MMVVQVFPIGSELPMVYTGDIVLVLSVLLAVSNDVVVKGRF